MKHIIVDTNAFLRFLLNDNREQKKAFEILLIQAKKSEIAIHVPQIIIFELHFALEKYYQFPKEEIIDKLNAIISSGHLQVERSEIFSSALRLYSKNTVSFVDCFLAAQVGDQGIELFAFDKKLKRLM